MSGNTIELLDLVARWVHVIAGIMWVGNSLLFNWLDRSLVSSTLPGQTRKPLGTIWLLHSGGFYYVEKTLLEGERMPAPLHWFKWQAYTTWLSGVALLFLVYYAGGRAVMNDPAVAKVSHMEASYAGIAAILGGWALYEVTQRIIAPRAAALAAALWVAGFIGITFGLTHVLSGRAAFLHVGAMLATIMTANVAMTIVPSQRELVAAVAEGRGADPVVSARAKRVSIFNNYFTFPVIVLMVSNHFPSLYDHHRSWVIILLLVAAGAAVRYVLNLRWTFAAWKPVLAATTLASFFVIWAVVRFDARTKSASIISSGGPVSFEDARHVLDRRCAVCHSERPSDDTFGAAPGGVMFDTRAQIESRAARILQRAVITRSMPPSNRTNISDAERELLGRWAAQVTASAR
ncbi:MAG TPA: urate hydroxylase PuuD [Gemmatimonadaceae bacterium]|nr:urate hydroxylase PuuD [Gemmatimonadaceae bacterium]